MFIYAVTVMEGVNPPSVEHSVVATHLNRMDDVMITLCQGGDFSLQLAGIFPSESRAIECVKELLGDKWLGIRRKHSPLDFEGPMGFRRSYEVDDAVEGDPVEPEGAGPWVYYHTIDCYDGSPYRETAEDVHMVTCAREGDEVYARYEKYNEWSPAAGIVTHKVGRYDSYSEAYASMLDEGACPLMHRVKGPWDYESPDGFVRSYITEVWKETLEQG